MISMHGWTVAFMMPWWGHRPDGDVTRHTEEQSSHTGGRFHHLLVVQDDIKEGAVHVDATIVFQEPQLPEFIHEEPHP
jgi:hypothetical protein